MCKPYSYLLASDREKLATVYRTTTRLTRSEEVHLFAWLEHRRRPDEWHRVMQRIMRALEHDPDYLEDKEWSEMEEIGRRLE